MTLMDEKLKISEERKEQLLMRVRECLDNGTLNLIDWMKIYDVLLEACHRESVALQEDMLTESIKEGEEDA